MLFGLFRRKQEIKAEDRVNINSLVQLLKKDDRIVIESHGASEKFIHFLADHNSSYEIKELTTYGTIANLARKELEYIFRKHETSLHERYWAGRALGLTPKQILNYHKFPREVPLEFMDINEEIRKELDEEAGSVNLSADDLNGTGLDILFNSEYPGEPVYYGYKLILKKTGKGYEIQELEITA